MAKRAKKPKSSGKAGGGIRIISGDYRSRRLHTPPDASTTRPVPDRVRTAVFNMLTGHLEDQPVFDAFAGTGAFGLEAASRGANPVILVERDKTIAGLLERSIEDFDAHDRVELVRSDALGIAALARCPDPVHIVFFDPPYPMMRDPDQRRRVLAQFARFIDKLDDDGFAILRTPWPFSDRYEIDEDGVRTLITTETAKERKRTEKRRLDDDEPAASAPDDEDDGVWVELDEDELEALLAEQDEDEHDDVTPDAEASTASGERRVVSRRVDLTLDNAEGPETHVYGSTAVHWYMRKRGTA